MKRALPRMPAPSRPAPGFTLLEMLVVMVLLSIVMTGLIAGLRSMAQTETRIDQRLTRLEELRIARSFLLSALAQVSADKIDVPNMPGKRMVPFEATSDTLSWVGNLPARGQVGGRHFFRLAMESVESRQELVLRFLPSRADLNFPDWSQADSRVLLKGITHLSVQAQGFVPQGQDSSNWPRGWETGWPVADALPERVRLQLDDGQGDVLQWVIAMRATARSDATTRGPVIGGTMR